jgi:hypothetical protein
MPRQGVEGQPPTEAPQFYNVVIEGTEKKGAHYQKRNKNGWYLLK